MRISFQTICLLVVVTFVHFAIVAGVTRIGEGPANFLSAVDGEAILEGLLEEKETSSPDTVIGNVEPEAESEEARGNGGEKEVEGHPLFSEREKVLAAASDPEKPVAAENEGITAETEEYSAFIDARLLAGRIESPDPDRYFRDAPARKRKENEAEVDADKNPVKPEPAEKKDIAPPKETSAVGPHKIRPISG